MKLYEGARRTSAATRPSLSFSFDSVESVQAVLDTVDDIAFGYVLHGRQHARAVV